MINYKKLTDLELAILTYAIEEDDPDEDEEITEERYHKFEEIYDALHKEYYARNLDVKMFSDMDCKFHIKRMHGG